MYPIILWQNKKTGLSEFLPRDTKEWTDGPSLMATELNGIYAKGLVNGCGVKISYTELLLIGGHGIGDPKNPYKAVVKYNEEG